MVVVVVGFPLLVGVLVSVVLSSLSFELVCAKEHTHVLQILSAFT